MIKEKQIKILETHYKNCLAYWKLHGENEIVAMGYALNDVRRVRNNLFSLKREPMDADIVQEVVDKYRKRLDEVIEKSHLGKLESEDDDHIRRCDHCGKAMKKGYYWGGEYYCSKKCLDVHYTQDEQDMNMFLLNEGEKLSDLSAEEKEARFDENDECYYTEWDSVYND